MRRVLAVVLALIAACGPKRDAERPPASATAKPRLVLLLVIDQWPSWVFVEQKHLFTGGIGRMIREGAVVARGELPYANTFTSVGHATIATGATPSTHGIVGNYWHRYSEGRDRPAEYDPTALPLVVGPKYGHDELVPDDGASARALRVDGVADALRAATGGRGKSITIAHKSRSACLVAGKRPDLAVWFEAAAGGMTTSSAYAKEAPPWLVELAKSRPASRYFSATWEPLDAALLARETKIEDAAPGESSHHGLDGAFPHSLADSDKPEVVIQETPFSDEVVFQTIHAAIEGMQLGADDVPDLLAVSFSAHDYAGHSWGPDSWEVLDLTLRLDRALGELFQSLDTRLGRDGWAVVLTSDHGATPLIERARTAGSRRIPPLEIEKAALGVLEKRLPDRGPWVAHIAAGNLYVTPNILTLPEEVKGPVLDELVTAVAAIPQIGPVGRSDRLPADCTSEQGLARAVCNARINGEAGALYVYASQGSVISDQKTGTGHDAPSDDTRYVPILALAPGLAPQQGSGSLLQVAPTVAALLGVAPPSAAREAPLFKMAPVNRR